MHLLKVVFRETTGSLIAGYQIYDNNYVSCFEMISAHGKGSDMDKGFYRNCFTAYHILTGHSTLHTAPSLCIFFLEVFIIFYQNG